MFYFKEGETFMDSRITCLLPKNMHPSREAFEDLGFIFKDLNDKSLVLATLPEDWYSTSSDSSWIIFINDEDCKRGSYLYDGSHSHMGLFQRYYICSEHMDPDRYPSIVKVLVKDRRFSKVLFCAGQCETETAPEFDSLVAKATNFLNAQYPDWENPCKYW